MTRTATGLMQTAWGLGLADRSDPFDEPIERQWMKQWLYYANSIRLASAMGGADNATFQTGWFDLTTHLREMHDWIDASEKNRISTVGLSPHGGERLRNHSDK